MSAGITHKQMTAGRFKKTNSWVQSHIFLTALYFYAELWVRQVNSIFKLANLFNVNDSFWDECMNMTQRTRIFIYLTRSLEKTLENLKKTDFFVEVYFKMNNNIVL